jgi:uncharacterized protein (DUF362 family)
MMPSSPAIARAAALLLLGRNAAAIDWIRAVLLGYDPLRIPIVRGAFSPFRWPIAPVRA